MNILGFNCFGHDSAASLVVDGKVVFAVEEERLIRKKHVGAFPEQAIRQCLGFAGLELADIDHVGFYWKPSLSYPHMPFFFLKYFPRMFSLLRESREWSMEENLGMIHYLKRMKKLPADLAALFPDGKRPKFKFHYLEHHLCHAASAFFCSPYEEAAILAVDGGGEWTTALLAQGSGNKIKKLTTVSIPYSLGAFYQAIARHLGFALITGPGKLMGLASYGNRDSSVYQAMKKMVRFLPNGGFKLDMSYFSYHYTRRSSGMSRRFERLCGPAKREATRWTQNELDVAAAAQRIAEDILIHMANYLHRKTGLGALTISGGVGLNSVANGRILKETHFKKIFIQPAAGDSGTSLGGALYIHHVLLARPRSYVMRNAFLGPGYTDADYSAELQKSGFPYCRRVDASAVAAGLLARGKILGWFQGRLEFGPRALGNRSILTSPCDKHMKDTLNARVKFRESFRPFAPIVLEESCGEYFDNTTPSPYMLLVYGVLENQKEKIPAVTHVDGSARVQTVSHEDNPELWELLNAFKKITGIPVLLNTSFNIKGEPIVCTPHDAVDSFRRADMDYLVLGNFVVGKKPEDLNTIEFGGRL